MATPITVRVLTDKEKFCLDAFLLNGDIFLAYTLSREEPTTSTDRVNIQKMAHRWKMSPVVQKYLQDNADKIYSSALIKNREKGTARTKQDVIDELNAMADLETDVKKRLDILRQIADIEKMKQDEERKKEDRVMYFLPLSCRDCSLHIEAQKRLNKERPEESE